MTAYSKAAKRRLRAHSRVLSRAEAARLRLPSVRGIVAAAELAVEAIDAARAGRHMDNPERPMARQSALERYLARGEVTRQQSADGERLLQDWLASGLQPQITSIYDMGSHANVVPVPGVGPGYVLYTRAMRAVGPVLAPILAHVVLFGYPASSWAEGMGRPRSDGIAALRLALDSLGLYYGGRQAARAVTGESITVAPRGA